MIILLFSVLSKGCGQGMEYLSEIVHVTCIWLDIFQKSARLDPLGETVKHLPSLISYPCSRLHALCPSCFQMFPDCFHPSELPRPRQSRWKWLDPRAAQGQMLPYHHLRPPDAPSPSSPPCQFQDLLAGAPSKPSFY